MKKWERGENDGKVGKERVVTEVPNGWGQFLCIFTVSFLLSSSSFLDRDTDSQFSRWDSWDREKKLWKKCTTLDTSVRNFNGM